MRGKDNESVSPLGNVLLNPIKRILTEESWCCGNTAGWVNFL